jgi:hypothetical protein
MTNANTHLRFQQRPTPVLPEHRPLYKIAQILLILDLASRGARSSLSRLHLFNWALKTPERGEKLYQAVSTKRLNVTAWGFDPALAIALRYACAEGLVITSSGGYELTETGQMFANSIGTEPLTLTVEKELLKRIGKGVTETMVEAVAKGWETK